jgi:nucleotide-binding universal stress UspA family protein
MYKKILVPLDGSELAECTLLHVTNLVKGGYATEVTVLNILEIRIYDRIEAEVPASILREIREKARDRARKYLASVEARFAAEEIEVKTVLLDSKRTASAITDYANKNSIDMIVLGTHGHTGLKKLMLGSVTLEVLHDSHVPVLLVRPEACKL